jgi:hypothetical protein
VDKRRAREKKKSENGGWMKANIQDLNNIFCSCQAPYHVNVKLVSGTISGFKCSPDVLRDKTEKKLRSDKMKVKWGVFVNMGLSHH